MADIIILNHWRQSRDGIDSAASLSAVARALDHIARDIRAAGHTLAADLVWMAAEELSDAERRRRQDAPPSIAAIAGSGTAAGRSEETGARTKPGN